MQRMQWLFCDAFVLTHFSREFGRSMFYLGLVNSTPRLSLLVEDPLCCGLPSLAGRPDDPAVGAMALAEVATPTRADRAIRGDDFLAL